MATTVTRQQAERALAAVKEQFKAYTEPFTTEAFTDAEGKDWPEHTFEPTCPPPTLSMDWDGRVAILWEEGPDEWAYRATSGGTSEEERILTAQAAKEFGHDPQKAVDAMKQDEPITWPKGVYAEPYNSFILCLYPA